MIQHTFFGALKFTLGSRVNMLVLSIEDDLVVRAVVGNAKTHYAQTWHQIDLSSVARYQPLQPEYVLAPYLSTVKGFMSGKTIGRFRCGCRRLHDTGRLLHKVPTFRIVHVKSVCFRSTFLRVQSHHFVKHISHP